MQFRLTFLTVGLGILLSLTSIASDRLISSELQNAIEEVVDQLGYDTNFSRIIFTDKARGLSLELENSDTENEIKAPFYVTTTHPLDLDYDAYCFAREAFEASVVKMGKIITAKSRKLKLMNKNDHFNFSGFKHTKQGIFKYRLDILVKHENLNLKALQKNIELLIRNIETRL